MKHQSSGSRRAHSWATRVFKVIGWSLAVVGVVSLLMMAHMAWRMFGTSHPDLSYISRLTGLRFPPSTRLVESRLDGEFMSLLHVKAEMRKTDAEKFVASLPKGSEVSREQILYRVESEKISWYNCTPRKYASAIATPADHFRSFILVDMDHEDRAVLYLYHTR